MNIAEKPIAAIIGRLTSTGDGIHMIANTYKKGVRLHTHLAETLDEEQFCQEKYGCSPVEYLDRLDRGVAALGARRVTRAERRSRRWWSSRRPPASSSGSACRCCR